MPDSSPENHLLITDAAELASWCAAAPPAATVAFDTEFERQRTYYAELCLAQAAVDGRVACIDPLGMADLAPLGGLLGDSRRRLVMHAARQDLEVLYQAGVPCTATLADTQVAAALAGFHEQIGYADLVLQLLGYELDKSQTRTDWRRRPLSARQLAYAADDVRHLEAVEANLRERLAGLGRLHWYAEDCAALADPALYAPPVELAWERVKGLAGLAPPARAGAVALATWRETRAQSRNLPRNWVLKDAELLAIAAAAPATPGQLAAALPDNPAFVRRHGDEALAIVREADPALAAQVDVRPPPDAAARQRIKACAAAVRERAEGLAIAPAVLLTRREVEQIVAGQVPERVAEGWRGEVLADLVDAYRGTATS
ncbi:MAG: ribonuclease D [Gammaproteobacteria bacterium]|nr:ribonuclease D [Gammaproteobacteria bacterium]